MKLTTRIRLVLYVTGVALTVSILTILGVQFLNQKSLFVTLITCGVINVAATAITVYWAIGKLTTPIRQVSEQMRQADLNTFFNSDRTDEVGELTTAFDKFIGSIRQTLLDVSDASSALASSTKEISASAENMARNAHNQSAQTASVSAAIEEMSRTVYEISHSVMNTKETAIQAQAGADRGTQVIEETVTGMDRMATMTKRSVDVINTLSDSTTKIGKVVTIIDDINKQINLIALNASIEATKAGEKGKGFSVVADEIKKLSERTAHSTTEIGDIVQKIRSNVEEATHLMGQSRSEADNGIRLSQEAKDTLKDISETFQQVTQMVTQVAVSSQQQSVTSDQIAENVKEIDEATQTIASSTQEVAKSADYLSTLTGNLQKLIRRFKLERNTSTWGA